LETDLSIDVDAACNVLSSVRVASSIPISIYQQFGAARLTQGSSTQIVPSSPLTQWASARFGSFTEGASQSYQSATQSLEDQVHAVPQSGTPERLAFHIAGLDALTGGGLPRGHILEISGAPNTPRELVGIGAARSALAGGGAVLWIDTQNMTKPYELLDRLSSKLSTT
jgi:hypothetical protein